MKILVTGSRGQLGYELQQFAASFPQGRFVFVDIDELDITDGDEVMEFVSLHRPEFIINTAAYTAVDRAEDEPVAAERVNAFAVGHLVKAAFSVNAYLLHVSTDYVFDGKKTEPYVETDAVNPLSVYGRTKLEGERAVQSYKRGIVVRTSWLYSSTGNNFVRTMLRLGGERDSVRVVNDQVGSPTYAADLAAALLRIVAKVAVQPGLFEAGIFHYTNAGACSWYEFAEKIMHGGQCDCRVEPCTTEDYPTKARRPAHSVLGCGKIQRVYDVVAPAWDDALKRCLKAIIAKQDAGKNENL
ncbi:MAG: dTDP-4-dehydrorhamnose reductase [Prevotellaceae bacterium]|jgi:dTDP-4-dehydrorhamnose reductase|nr:dTDP-4-dehydrorhamnose reductase [Prevotellaceae bacterium]